MVARRHFASLAGVRPTALAVAGAGESGSMSRGVTTPVRTSAAESRRCGSRWKLAAAVLLAFHTLMLIWGAWRQSPTIDEVPYLTAGISHWHLGRFDLCRVNPPLVRLVAALPVLASRPNTDWTTYSTQEPSPTYRVDFDAGSNFLRANGSRVFWRFSLARCACIPFSLLGGWLCFRWGSDLFGDASGTMALALWCFSPNILAHGQLMTPDVGGTALGLAAAYSYRHWLRDPRWERAAIAGLALGLAELARTTWIILFVLWPVVWLVWTWSRSRRPPWAVSFRSVAQLSVVLLLGLHVLNLGYLFDGTLRPLGEYRFVSRTLAGFDTFAAGVSGNRFRGEALGGLPIPLPEDYVQGIDIQKGDFEQGAWSYLAGQWRQRGWWYYYAYALLIKVPLGTWLLILLGCMCAFLSREYRAPWREEMMLWLPGMAIFLLVSSQTGFNHHMRYLLGAFPFALIWASRVARSDVLGDRTVAFVAAVALVWSVLSSLWIYPHSMSYFNESVGGPTRGEWHLVDSNIDWGQDLFYLKRWLQKHPEAQPLRTAYFPTLIDVELAGIRSDWPPVDPRSSHMLGRLADEVGPQPGWYAVSVNELHVREGQYAYFLEFEPVASAGYSIRIYHISREGANRVRKQIGLPPLAAREQSW